MSDPGARLADVFGGIDIYLFDQLLRGRIRPGMSLLEAGCGGGRNLVYFLREGYDVSAIDPDPEAIASVRALARRLAPAIPASNFRGEPVERSSFPDEAADVVVSSAVLHFARDEAHFRAMLDGTWRLKNGFSMKLSCFWSETWSRRASRNPIVSPSASGASETSAGTVSEKPRQAPLSPVPRRECVFTLTTIRSWTKVTRASSA